MSGNTVKRYFPKTRLMELVRRPGGITGDEAIANALKLVESVRGQSVEAIEAAISALETALPEKTRSQFSEEQMIDILKKADRIITLSGTFGYDLLSDVAKKLCDLTDGLVQQKLGDFAPVAVHVRALRLVAPGSKPLTPEEYAQVLDELDKVLAYFKCEHLTVEPGLLEEDELVSLSNGNGSAGASAAH